MMNARTRTVTSLPRIARGGFTLVEMLAVVLIIGILLTFLLTNLGSGEDVVKQGATQARLAELATANDELDNRHGDYAGSSVPAELGGAAGQANRGAEALYLALCAEGAPGFGQAFSEALCNTDGDRFTKTPKGFATAEAFELTDAWDNPIAYFHYSDYDQPQTYVTYDTDTGEEIERQVRAHVNPQTQRHYNIRSYQLISAGADGIFGPGEDGHVDDITNFEP